MRQGVFLFGDVSGFTPLSEQLKAQGQEGAELITAIINDLFTELVRILFNHGGSLLKFGGDALLGLFPAETGEGLAEGALRAVQASLAMQEVMKQDRFTAIEAGDELRTLRIKCGVSAGSYFAAHIGTAESMAYVTTGHTVGRAEQAEGQASPGEIVIAQEVYDLVGSQVQVGPPGEEPKAGFYLIRNAPWLEGTIYHHMPEEPPDGGLQAQITYLVSRLDRLSPYLNPDLLRRMITNPKEVLMPPDHRPVTVMFANYVGISDLVEDMGDTHPQVITQRLNDYFVHMAQVVERYEGTLARMDQYAVGDRLVIFFGAPRAHEDDPRRAVNTALDMQQATRQHFAALQTSQGIYRFRQRIGINTGHLFAGNVGAPHLRQEYTLMGDDINTAARLMSSSSWGEVLISQKCQERVRAFFELEDRGRLKVKGKKTPIAAFQVLGHRDRIGRVRGLATGQSRLIGRDDALDTLHQCAKGLQSGRGCILSIIGDSGLGKSRLAREFRAQLLNRQDMKDLRWLAGQALSFSEHTSYWLAAQMLVADLELGAEANQDDALFSLWERGESLLGKDTAREAIPFLAHLMGLQLEGEWARWVKELDPQVRQKQTFWAAREFFTAAAQQRPTIISLDDLHWADEASLDLVTDLLRATIHAPLMLCLIFRPLRDRGCWALRHQAANTFPRRYTEVALPALTKTQSEALLRELLPGAEFTPGTLREILIKSAGNPFYLEEIVRSLIAAGAVAQDEPQPPDPEALDPEALIPARPSSVGRARAQPTWRVTSRIEQITVPDTLQGIIIARIDRLTEDVRQVLQMAAVIGRRFPLSILHRLAEAKAEVEAWLAQLERSDLIEPVELAPEPTYMFSDALVQEVAYDNLLVRRRQGFHKQVGSMLEEIFAGRLEQACELLAYHFSRSDDSRRAAVYLEMAGRKAQSEFANETAIRYYTALLERLRDGENGQEKRFDTLAHRQRIFGLVGQPDAREKDLTAMLDLADQLQDKKRHSDALNELADLCQWTGRYAEAREAAEEALDLKSLLEDNAGQATAYHQLGVLDYYAGDYSPAQSSLERAVSLWQRSGDRKGEAWSLMYLGMIQFFRGDLGRAAGYHREALQMARERQDWFQEGIHLTNAARVSLRLGQYEPALARFDESLEIKTRVGDRTGQGFSLFYKGLALIYLDRLDAAETTLEDSLKLRKQINDERGIGYCLYGLGLVALERRRFGAAKERFQRSHDIHSQLGLSAESIVDLSCLGQACLGLGAVDKAHQASEQAMALLAEQQDVEEVQQVYLNHYRVLAARQDPSAQNLLQQAHNAMMEQAARISDAQMRQVFLDEVRTNQQIRAAMEGSDPR
jgi:class 3 adenylate cyclase/tetratricopeptide (TPR) repeat protein